MLFFFLLLAIFISSGGYLFSQEKGELKNFSDPKNRYTLKLPSIWEESIENGETIFTALKGDKDFATCYVFGFPVEAGMTLKDISSWLLEGFDQGGDGYKFKILSQNKINIAGVEGLLIKQQEEYKDGEREEIILIDEYFFIKNGQCIILHFDTLKNSYNSFKEDFSKIVDSFNPGSKPFEDVLIYKDEGENKAKPSPSPLNK